MITVPHVNSADNPPTNSQIAFCGKAEKEDTVDELSEERLVLTSAQNLAKSLAAAQQRCRAASKDSRNSYHGYKYASSEAIITEAKAALADSGLSVTPMKQHIENAVLSREFLLMHESGESLSIATSWPIVPDKGRPLDKAVAIAATSSLAYLLRDLLLMPRVDDADDLPAQTDKQQPVADRATTDQLKKLREYKTDLAVGTGDWGTIIAKRGVSTAKELTVTQADELIKALANRIATRQLADGLAEQEGGAAQATSKSD
jgi:hypothetical protein